MLESYTYYNLIRRCLLISPVIHSMMILKVERSLRENERSVFYICGNLLQLIEQNARPQIYIRMLLYRNDTRVQQL